MNLDYTYIELLGFRLFEPVTILTNSFITIFSVMAYLRTLKLNNKLSTYWSIFFLLMGLSSLLGSLCHGIHDQWSQTFLNVCWFLMNAVSLIGLYFFYLAAFTYSNLEKESSNKTLNYVVLTWIILLLVITFFLNNFLLVKIHAGIGLMYSLIVHFMSFKNKQAGSGYIAAGIAISFLSILVHSIKFSFGEWFNYKDISHMIMLTTLLFIFKGVRTMMAEGDLSVQAN